MLLTDLSVRERETERRRDGETGVGVGGRGRLGERKGYAMCN